MRVLIVDDELSELVQRELERQGWAVDYTTTAADVLARLSERAGEPYDLLLLNLDMPEVSALEALEEIRGAHLDLDIIVITGYDGDEDKAIAAISLGAIDYLHEPISLDELRTALFRVRQKRAAEGKEAFQHRILVVDDEEDLSARIKRELEKQGYEVAVAYNGLEGLENFKNNYVDVVIADVRMSRIDGLEMLEQCRAINPDVVSIVITGFGDYQKAIKSLRLGVFDYLRKPISLDELINVVDRAVELLTLRRGLSARQRELEIESARKTRYAENLEEEITERKILELELKEEARARGQFINILAHELRTPLTSMMICAEMLMDILSSNPESTHFKLTRTILNGTQAMSSRLDELLDLARFSAGTFILYREALDIRRFLEKVAAKFQPVTEGKYQHLLLELPATLPAIEADPSRLEQVLMNLLLNASKFSPEGRTITLRAMTDGTELVVEIEDRGIGISSEQQARLFEPYHRVEQDRHAFPGLGLGLVISKQIIEAHGGRIWLTSEPGQGSTFSFSLPVRG
jgi:signal transduction histidine kinase